jgi:hypothetical protein
MSLVSGPGRGGKANSTQELFVQKHVDYIKSLDTVRHSLCFSQFYCIFSTRRLYPWVLPTNFSASEKTSWNTG